MTDNERKGHTPGPYLREGALIYALDESGTCNRISIRVEGGFVKNWKSVCHRTTDEETEATAEFAHRACNNHYELLDALKRAHKWLLICNDVRSYKDFHAVEAAITKAEG